MGGGLFWTMAGRGGRIARTGDAPVTPVTTYAETLLALSPDSYWRLGDSSGNAADSSGNGYTLTAGGAATYGADGWAADGGKAMTFDADWFMRSNEAWMNVGTSDFSVSWVHRINGTPTLPMHIVGHRGTGTTGEWAVQLKNSTDGVYIRCGTSITLTYSGVSLFDNAWKHCVLAADRSGSATLYVDGTSRGTADISANVASDLTGNFELWLGSRNSTPSYPVIGDLCEVAVWTGTLLTSGDASALYAAR